MWLDRGALEVKTMPAAGAPAVRRSAPRVRIGTGERLLRAVTALAGGNAQFVSQGEAPWASVTFAGSRHTIVLRFAGWEACDDAEHFIAQFADHEFAIPGVLVADAGVTRCDQKLLPEPLIEIELDLLLLDEG